MACPHSREHRTGKVSLDISDNMKHVHLIHKVIVSKVIVSAEYINEVKNLLLRG